MSRILVVGEDALCCALGERIVAEALPDWRMSRPAINTNGITKLVPAIPRYVQQSRHVQPVLCIGDTDHRCALALVKAWVPQHAGSHFLFRLAVPEAESWVLSDRAGVAEFFGVSEKKIPNDPDVLPDPKREVLRLARASKVKTLRNEVVSPLDASRTGSGYNVHLCGFVRERWRAVRAVERSESLRRAFQRVIRFGADHAMTEDR